MSICPGNVIFGLILLENIAFTQNVVQKKKSQLTEDFIKDIMGL